MDFEILTENNEGTFILNRECPTLINHLKITTTIFHEKRGIVTLISLGF